MVEFKKDRQVEKEAYATINFLQLLSQARVAELTELPKETFLAIGGAKTVERLILDCKEKNIDIFTKSIGELFFELDQNIACMNSITSSKSVLTDAAVKNYELYKNFYSVSSGINKEAYIDLTLLRAIPDDKILEILDFRSRGR